MPRTVPFNAQALWRFESSGNNGADKGTVNPLKVSSESLGD